MKLPIVSGLEVIKFLEKQGFELVSRKSSHVRMKKKDSSGNVLVTVIPVHKRLDPGTLLAILRQCNITRDYFIEHI